MPACRDDDHLVDSEGLVRKLLRVTRKNRSDGEIERPVAQRCAEHAAHCDMHLDRDAGRIVDESAADLRKQVFAHRRARADADMIERHWDGIAAYCRPENKVSLGFVEGLNNKIRVIQRRAYGLKNEEYFRLKVLTCMLPEL